MSSLVQLIEIPHQEKVLHVSPKDEFLSLNQQNRKQVSEDMTISDQCFYINRVLFLVGSGIRGLAQIEVLMKLEHRTGHKITEHFD